NVIKGKGSYIVSSDEYNSSKLAKSSIISGILSTGSQAIDIANSTIPICRFGVKYFKADGGIHIRGYNSDENMIYIEFINNKGANIDRGLERKIENTFILENFNRFPENELEDIVSIDKFSQIYIKEGIEQVKHIEKISSQKPKIIISSPSRNILSLAE